MFSQLLLRIIIFCVCACVVCSLHAQRPCYLISTGHAGVSQNTLKFDNKTAAMQHVRSTYSALVAEGYLDARIDTSSADTLLRAHITSGKKYVLRHVAVHMDTLPVHSSALKKGRSFGTTSMDLTAEKLIAELENDGYPFASVRIKQVSIDSMQSADVELAIARGPRMVLDSIIIRSDGQRMPQRYVRSYLNMRPGSAYNESNIARLQTTLREIPFLQSKRPPEVRFRQGTYELSLFLEKKKANTFSGILGLRPDEATGKMNITGDAEIKLLNALNSGEELYMNWRKLQPQTQDILLRTSLPFLFGTPVGADAELKIYKRDSTFSQVKSRLGATLRLGGNNKLKLFAEKNTVSQLSQVAIATSLANVNTNFYGLALQWEKLDYRNNPRKGMTLQCEAATGTRQVRGTNLDTDAAPVDVQDKNVNRAEVMAEFYLPTWKAQCLRMASQAATIAAPQLFDNEAYRIGGLRTLRGVNEESLYATSWTVATLEYRFLLSENSALYAFADKAWYEKRTINQYIADSPFSFGAGINFETGAGIFAFNYALGSQFSQPILFRNAKLSFGFKSVF